MGGCAIDEQCAWSMDVSGQSMGGTCPPWVVSVIGLCCGRLECDMSWLRVKYQRGKDARRKKRWKRTTKCRESFHYTPAGPPTSWVPPCFFPIADPSVENEDQPTSHPPGEQTAGGRFVSVRRCWVENLNSALLGFIRRCWAQFAVVVWSDSPSLRSCWSRSRGHGVGCLIVYYLIRWCWALKHWCWAYRWSVASWFIFVTYHICLPPLGSPLYCSFPNSSIERWWAAHIPLERGGAGVAGIVFLYLLGA